MLFKEYHIPMIRSGSKWATRREWAENYAGPSVGTVVAATTELFVSDDEADCYIQIVNRYEQPLGEMSDENARAEGDYEDLEEFREGYEKVYGEGSWDPEKVVEVVEFEYVGKSRPDEQKKLLTDGGRELEDKPLGMSGVAWRGCSCGACRGERRRFLGRDELDDGQATLGGFDDE